MTCRRRHRLNNNVLLVSVHKHYIYCYLLRPADGYCHRSSVSPWMIHSIHTIVTDTIPQSAFRLINYRIFFFITNGATVITLVFLLKHILFSITRLKCVCIKMYLQLNSYICIRLNSSFKYRYRYVYRYYRFRYFSTYCLITKIVRYLFYVLFFSVWCHIVEFIICA